MFSFLTNMIIMYVDIALLIMLLGLILFACSYCAIRVRRLQQNGQVAILLKPTKVLFSHRTEEEGREQLRTVVAYQNPFTGDYCIHKSRPSQGFMNAMPSPQPESTDSGVSDEYEPLKPLPLPGHPRRLGDEYSLKMIEQEKLVTQIGDVNGVNKTWNWNYKEYQI